MKNINPGNSPKSITGDFGSVAKMPKLKNFSH
jgi:hypothetical protein